MVEIAVRTYWEKVTGSKFPAISCVNKERPYLLATLDGSNGECMIEVKLLTSWNPKYKQNKEAAGYLKWEAAMKEGIVPQEYYPQIQHQLSVTGLNMCMFLGYAETKGKTDVNYENLAVVTVSRDQKYIDELVRIEDEFWEQVTRARSNDEI